MSTLSADQAYALALARYASGSTAECEELCRAVVAVEQGHPAAALLALLLFERNDATGAKSLMRALAAKPAHTLTVDYAIPTGPRYAAHPMGPLDARLAPDTERYRELLRSFCAFAPQLERIAAVPAGAEPGWINVWFPALDAVALYGFIAKERPRRYIEAGSGLSTRFARRAVADHDIDCEIISIDPAPRVEVDALCDMVLRQPLERVDLRVFEEAKAGDVVFIDSSHRVFTGSDVTVFFTEVLPALAPGVIVGVHDVFLPYDYPAEWTSRYYSEQYLLACMLLAKAPSVETLLPVYYLTRSGLPEEARALCARLPGSPPPGGASFWLRKEA